MLVLVRSELLEQFLNTLTADNQQSRYNREKLWQQVPMQTSLKLKPYSRFFYCISRMYVKFGVFRKKRSSLIALVLQKLLTAKQLSN